MSDTIILDSKKCNAELLTIHADGRITVSEDLKPTETAAEVLRIMRDQWLADIQCAKIREQEERIKRLEDAGNELRDCASRIGTVASGEASVIRRTQEAIEEWNNKTK
jgi:hypothetical protein